MKIYTSYFAKNAQHPRAKSICRWPPKWYNGVQCGLLAPSVDLLTGYKMGTVSEEEYTETYLSYLNRLGLIKVLAVLNDGDVLLCYEKPGDFCHRHILARWLNNNGVEVEEIDYGKT